MSNILTANSGHLKTVTLDRPEALNSLNGEMVKALLETLENCESDSQIESLFIKGSGGRAFCAGGDIKAARLGAIAVKEGRMSLEEVVGFFVEEYTLNKKLYHFGKKSVSFMNGITMGGGVGIAGACKFRIATEKTVWAMPEVSIGFFPDVGAAHYLAKAPYFAGRFLGLTGSHISNPADLMMCGFATHFVATEDEDRLTEALLEKGNFDSVLTKLQKKKGETFLPYSQIEKCFSFNNVEEILEALQQEASDWALQTKALIESKSPTSLKVTLRHIQMAERETFDQVIDRDLRLAGKFLMGDDLIEGVRSVVVNKDKSPKWNPPRLQDVGIERIEDYFN